MDDVIYTLEGVNGQLYLYHNRVVIKRKGAIAKLSQGFFKGEKEIFISQISGIQVRDGTVFTNGYIQFTLSGGNESTKGILSATQDENSIMFAKNNNELVKKIKNKIYELKNSQTQGAIQQLSTADEILKYKSLLDMEVITQEEFDKKKHELLSM